MVKWCMHLVEYLCLWPNIAKKLKNPKAFREFASAVLVKCNILGGINGDVKIELDFFFVWLLACMYVFVCLCECNIAFSDTFDG